MVQDSPSRRQDQFIIRLPDGMRERIRHAADGNNRSMNAEIVATLEEKYPPPSLRALLDRVFETRSHVLAKMTSDDVARLQVALGKLVDSFEQAAEIPPRLVRSDSAKNDKGA